MIDVREKARDTKRLSEMKQVVTALELYYSDYGYYPEYGVDNNIAHGCSAFNNGNALDELVSEGYLPSEVIDPVDDSSSNPALCYGYLGVGNHDDYSWDSGWCCDGVIRTEYKYSLFFSSESTDFNEKPLNNKNMNLEYCITGPRL